MTNIIKSPVEVLHEFIDEAIRRRKDTLGRKINRYPRTQFIASDVHDCDRYMVHSILDWEQRPLHDEGLQAIFDAGNKEEANVKARMAEDGWDVIHQQMPFEVKTRKGEVICRGKIDGKVMYGRTAIPWEIKSMDGNIFRGIKCIEDFQHKVHLRKYLRQMQLYLFGNNAEAGLFTLSDFRHEKHIPVVLDYGDCEHILGRLERNWEFVKAKKYPDRIEYDSAVCGRCPFQHICLPDIKNAGAHQITNDEVLADLNRWTELKPLAAEFKRLDEEIKEYFRNKADVLVNLTYRVLGRATKGQARICKDLIPPDLVEKYTKREPGWKTEIVKLGDDGKPETAKEAT